MKKKAALIAIAAFIAISVTGCGIVTVVPIGEEGKFTGEVEFDSSAESSSDWEAVVEEITANAEDFAELLNGDGVGKAAAVTGKATVKEFVEKGPKKLLSLEVEGYDGDTEIMMQVGGVYSGTAIRDVQTIKNFESFTNQTEWSQYGKALNSEADAQVLSKLEIDASAEGKTVTFVGAAAEGATDITVTPVSLTIE